MGCDIHLFVEKKLRNGRWAMVRDLNQSVHKEGMRPWSTVEGAVAGGWWKLSDRNYNFFARLAGVRGDGPEAKGLPKDVSDYLWEESEAYGQDGHSHSWSTPLEVMEAYISAMHEYDTDVELDVYVQTRLTEGVERAYLRFMRDMCSLEADNGDEYRFVYWFDN